MQLCINNINLLMSSNVKKKGYIYTYYIYIYICIKHNTCIVLHTKKKLDRNSKKKNVIRAHLESLEDLIQIIGSEHLRNLFPFKFSHALPAV